MDRPLRISVLVVEKIFNRLEYRGILQIFDYQTCFFACLFLTHCPCVGSSGYAPKMVKNYFFGGLNYFLKK